MKTSFIIFFAIVLTIYGLVNFYIFMRGWQAIPANPALRISYISAFIVLSLSWLAGRILENNYSNAFSDMLIWTGSFWLGAMVYFLFIVIITDLTRLINKFINFLPEPDSPLYSKLKLIVFFVSTGIVIVVVFAGYINARNPRINTLEIKINKKAGNLKELNIAMASDIHLGTVVNNEWFSKIVSEINSLNPDIVLLAGDIVDEDVKPVIRNNLGEQLKNIKSKYGTYGITGNHEYIGGVEPACKYLAEHGVTMLRDTSVLIDGSFYVAGREDRDISRFAGKSRKKLSEILEGVDKNLPVIVMNHQPFDLDEAVKEKADLHLSGHTHGGQLFPFNFLTEKIYEISRGYLKKEDTHFFVSNGAGTWGPPVRIGNRPEVVNIRIIFPE
ncbi:MAG: metallophosphoesterase [Ignavibacteriae bacterium]|nr:metallophosphoesterase [Ignavibacteriota bacterium]